MKLFEVEKIEELDFEDVYDISIDEGPEFFQDEHNYIANNIVVHNSHAAGFVVSDIPIEQIAPLRRATKGALATQFTGPELESLGLIKFDILGLSMLTVIKKCIELIKENYDIDIDIANLPLNDEPTFKLYRTGNLGGVFQCEQPGMQHTMREIGVDRFDDIMAGVALYRPGPMDNIPDYCSRKKGDSMIDYFHPTIEPFVKNHLEKTYGILIYQEQLMQICNSLSNFSITDGYIMIKAIGKKKIELMNKFEKQFIAGAVENGVPQEVVEQYWEKFIVPFANYGFNACLDGEMVVKNAESGKSITIEELEKQYRVGDKNIKLHSYSDGEIVIDEVLDVFCTGEKDVYNIELDNSIILKCTLDHKFMCDDDKEHTVEEIIKKDLNILYFEEGDFLL